MKRFAIASVVLCCALTACSGEQPAPAAEEAAAPTAPAAEEQAPFADSFESGDTSAWQEVTEGEGNEEAGEADPDG